MGQPEGRFWIAVVAALATIVLAGCERDAPKVASGKRPTVASLVPAASNLLLGMGAQDHLVAISNWDTERLGLTGLPRVGDYRTIDWEKIAQLHPDVLIVQFRADKMPPGLQQRADELGIRLLNVRINRLDEIFVTLRTLGETVQEPAKAAAVEKKLRDQLDAVRRQVAGRPPVRTLLARDASLAEVVGGGNFLDDLLTIAGGVNVIPQGDNLYPSIDRELLQSLNPDAVLQLLPDASAQVLEQARQNRLTMPPIGAIRNNRVYSLTEWYVLQPGYQVGDLAELFARHLHGPAATTQVSP